MLSVIVIVGGLFLTVKWGAELVEVVWKLVTVGLQPR